MKISAIQPKINTQYSRNLSCKKIGETPAAPEENLSFKGKGTGALAGGGLGLVATLAAIGSAAIARVFVLPAVFGGAALLGGTAAGAALGDKIEDKITGSGSKNNK